MNEARAHMLVPQNVSQSQDSLQQITENDFNHLINLKVL